jgi:hypothetical protein
MTPTQPPGYPARTGYAGPPVPPSGPPSQQQSGPPAGYPSQQEYYRQDQVTIYSLSDFNVSYKVCKHYAWSPTDCYNIFSEFYSIVSVTTVFLSESFGLKFLYIISHTIYSVRSCVAGVVFSKQNWSQFLELSMFCVLIILKSFGILLELILQWILSNWFVVLETILL